MHRNIQINFCLVSEFSHHQSTVHQINSTNTTTTAIDEVDAVHSRFRGRSPSPSGGHQYSNVINQRNGGGLLIIGTFKS
jgi:hypothetical protein